MDILDGIVKRRSIRKFKSTPIPRDIIEQLLSLTVQTPSGKNNQPWRFVVVEGEKKDELVSLLFKVLDELKGKGVSTGSFENTINVIDQAPVIVFVFNAYYHDNVLIENNYYKWMVDIQSIGGAIQTMLLAAQRFGLGTLWICDVLFANKEIGTWLNRKEQLVAAVSIGYPDQSPHPRPRKGWEEVTQWYGGRP